MKEAEGLEPSESDIWGLSEREPSHRRGDRDDGIAANSTRAASASASGAIVVVEPSYAGALVPDVVAAMCRTPVRVAAIGVPHEVLALRLARGPPPTDRRVPTRLRRSRGVLRQQRPASS
jgi:hypothetical protein